MKIIIGIISLFLLFSCQDSSKQAKVVKNEPWVIEANGLGPIQLNDTINKVRQRVSQTFTVKDVEHGGFVVIDNGKELIKVRSKYRDGLVGYIEIYDPMFKTADGLHCGMKIPQLKKIRSDLRIEKDEMTGQEYFAPKELQDYPTQDGPPNTLNLIYLKPETSGDLAEEYRYQEKKGFQSFGEISDEGEISFFRIYNWR